MFTKFNLIIGSLSTDVREPRTAIGKALRLVDDCGLTLQTRWREDARIKEKNQFSVVVRGSITGRPWFQTPSFLLSAAAPSKFWG